MNTITLALHEIPKKVIHRYLEQVSPVRLSSLAEVLAHTRGIFSLNVDFEVASVAVEFDTALVTEAWIEGLLEVSRDA